MFDFTKIEIPIELEPVLRDKLDFFQVVNSKTGEIPPQSEKAYDKKLKFLLFPNGSPEIHGTPHKYLHNGKNYDNFYFSEVFQFIEYLYREYSINPFTAPLHNLEFGVNIEPSIPVKQLLKLIMHHKREEPEVRRYKGNGYLLRFYSQQYELKIYNKGLQYGLAKEVLRFEIKVKKMAFFKGSIKTLADLLHPEKVHALKELLLTKWNELFFIANDIPKDSLTKCELKVIEWANEVKDWKEMYRQQDRTTYKKKIGRYREIVERRSQTKPQTTAGKLIGEKWEQLLRIDQKTFNKLTEFLNQFPEFNFQHFIPSNSRVISLLLPPQERRFCINCNRDISHQRNTSLSCSEKYFGSEGKKCRNDRSNPKHNHRKKQEKEKTRIKEVLQLPALFPQQNLIRAKWVTQETYI